MARKHLDSKPNYFSMPPARLNTSARSGPDLVIRLMVEAVSSRVTSGFAIGARKQELSRFSPSGLPANFIILGA